MAKKTESVNTDDLIGELDGIVEEAGDLPIVIRLGRGGGAKRTIPKELALVLKQKFDNVGAFPIPREWLETKLGYPSSGAMKGRPNQIKDGLNRQHADIVGDGKIWHVGNHRELFYTIAVASVDADEELKWKKPAEWKKKHPELVKTKKEEETTEET